MENQRPYVNIREDLTDKVYQILLGLAHPETGNVRVLAAEIRAFLNDSRYVDRHISTAIRYLVEDGKLEYVMNNGVAGVTVRVKALAKGNTIITMRQPTKESIEELFKPDPGKKELPAPEPTPEPAPVKEVSESRKPSALEYAEMTLKDTDMVYSEILKGFVKLRRALKDLTAEVKRNG